MFSKEKKNIEEEEDEWLGFVQSIKNFVSKQHVMLKKDIGNLRGELSKEIKEIKDGLSTQAETQSKMLLLLQ
jgi:hypothetical protein